MKNICVKACTMGFSLFLACLHPAQANDAPVNLQGGGAQVLAGAVYAISMDSEVVKITLGKTSYTVDATFNFLNTGESMRVDVGFPKRGAGWLGDDFHQVSDFLKFETWVEGKPVQFVEAPGTVSIEGSYTLPGLIDYIKQTKKLENLKNLMVRDYRWMVKEKVLFPGSKTTSTRVRYEAPYQNFGAECKGGLTYIYGTGSHWKGKKGYIGESRFIVDGTGLPKKDRPTEMNFTDEKEKAQIKCDTISEGVVQCVIKNYKPATEDAGVVVGVGCIDFEEK
jgi:hypothetical protein